ncbi:MAG: hypothetical protein NTW21_35760, partial [Verrucomicrobia bacterium]|nr:hypothetical protein [Verrucomicrobiota bacterium]
VGDAAKDLIEVTGDATLTGTLNLAELGTLTPDTWYTVLTTTGTITDTLTLADPANWTKQVVGSNTLQVKAGATPQTAILSTVSADPATVTVDNSSTITVTLKDSASHFLSGKNVSLAKLPGPGTPTITTLIGTTGGDGIATFKVESTTPGAYIFQATDDTDSVTINQTATVTFTVGAVAKLAFTTQPGNGIPDSPLATQPKVTLQDAYGNTVTGTAQDVTVEIQDNAGPGGVLSGTKTVAVDTGTGVATFSGLSIDLIGTDYTLTATGSTVNTSAGVVVSSPFSVLARPVGWWWTNQVTGVWSAASTWRDGGGWPTTTGDYAGADRNCTVTYGSGDNHSITGFEWGHNPGDATSSILNMTGGTLAVAGTGAWFSLGASGGATLNQSGGTINVGTDAQIGQYYSQGNMPISWNLTGPGTVAITGNFRIGYNQGQSSGRAGNCTFTQSGSGSSVSVGGNLTIGTIDNNASAIGRSYVYNLSDGTLAVAGTVQFDPLGTRQFNFTGGTLSFGT